MTCENLCREVFLERKISTAFEEFTTMTTNNTFHVDCSSAKKPTAND